MFPSPSREIPAPSIAPSIMPYFYDRSQATQDQPKSELGAYRGEAHGSKLRLHLKRKDTKKSTICAYLHLRTLLPRGRFAILFLQINVTQGTTNAL